MYLLEVELEGHGTLRADVDGRDIRRWEAQTGESFIRSEFDYTCLTELARLSLKRTGVLVMTSDEFDAVCTSVKEVDVESADPTQTDPGAS